MYKWVGSNFADRPEHTTKFQQTIFRILKKWGKKYNIFLDGEQVCKATEDPDEGIDYVFMLKSEDWEILANVWESLVNDNSYRKSPYWKMIAIILLFLRRIITNSF